MNKLLNQLYVTRRYVSELIQELENGNSFDKKSDFSTEIRKELNEAINALERFNPTKVRKKSLLWYPNAIIPNFRQKTQGKFKKNYPQGLIVHWIWAPQVGGKDNAEFWAKWGKEQGYTFFTLGNDGSIIQSFPLDEWGYHAGESYWPNVGNSVSQHLVGIEIVCEGRIQKFEDGRYGNERKTNSGKITRTYVDETHVRHIKDNNENIAKGYYQMYTAKQEEALINLVLWLKQNNPDKFDLDLVLGHDEVAGPSGLGLINATYESSWRKTDPGGSLSMTMPKFRALLKEMYSKL